MIHRFRLRPIWLLLAGLSLVSIPSLAGDTALPNMLRFPNPTGYAATFSATGKVDLTGPFFQSLGTNGRSCGSCHQPSDGWTVTPAHLQQRFDASDGTDPVFRTNDGANAPELDVSTVDARRSAYSMLLSKGLIRVGIGMPSGPGVEFELVAVDDPYGHASAQDLSLFRRPLPATNLKFPEHGDVGRPRDVQGLGVAQLRDRHEQLFCNHSVRPRRSVERRHARACTGRDSAERSAAPGDRRVRERFVHSAGIRCERRGARRQSGFRRSGLLVGAGLVLRRQRCDRGRLPDGCAFQLDRVPHL